MSSPDCSMIQPASSCGYGVTRTWRVMYSLGRSSSCWSRSSFRRKASAAESSVRMSPGSQVPPCSMTPKRRVGKRSSTPSMISVPSTCITGYWMAM